MPICSYLAVPLPGQAETLGARLGALPGCEVIRSTNRDVLVLLTDTSGRTEEEALRSELEAVDGLAALVLTFGALADEDAATDPEPCHPARNGGGS